jgi:hypothetical protein
MSSHLGGTADGPRGSISGASSSSAGTASPIHCLHPECMALATDDSQPRCRKVPQQFQTFPSQQQSQQQPPISPASASSSGYIRPRHSKLQCDQCKDYPDGFRSEHELRRHTNRVHKELRKVWITVDASENKTFLANCKACTSGKRYNECYNAASHLRRMHFHPRKRGEGKNEKRGGAGSLRSEDPPMEDLKRHWLREIEESAIDAPESSTDRHRADDEERMDLDSEDSSPKTQTTPK